LVLFTTMRLAILGNSGSGKSTLARWVARTSGAAYLDLDTVAWLPDRVAVPRPEPQARAEVASFCATQASWVVEGCYASLIGATLPFSPRLILLNPGQDRCVANCLARPWEPHKYASKAEQDQRLAFLVTWVKDYFSRTGEMSLTGHRSLFQAYAGDKHELCDVPALDAPAPDLLALLWPAQGARPAPRPAFSGR
jgi:adenylate kinase family enzyme